MINSSSKLFYVFINMDKEAQSVKLTCSNHTKLLLDGLWVKYEQREETDLYIDVATDSGLDPLQVHRLPLSIIAPHFFEKFNNYRCALNFDRYTIASVLEFIYRGQVDVCKDNLEELSKAAKILGIDLLLNAIKKSREKLKKEEIESEEEMEIAESSCSDTESEERDEDYNYEEDISSGNSIDDEAQVDYNLLKNKPNKTKKSLLAIKCVLCDYVTDKQKAYSVHLRRKHQLDEQQICVQINFKCTECSFIGTSKEELNEHKKNEHVKRKFQCSECDFSSDKKQQFDRHFNFYHGVDRPFRCDSCDYTTRTANTLSAHKMIHSGETFECKICSRKFATRYYLDRHVKRHKDTEKEFSCQFCEYKSGSQTSIDLHLKVEHQFVNQKPLIKRQKIPIGGFKCTHCQYKTRYRRAWKNHMATQHQVDPDGNTVTPSIRCKLCDFTCLVNTQLYTHMAKDHLEKRFKCQLCAFNTFRKAAMTIHTQTVHGTERPYMCETCGLRFKTPVHLSRHTPTHTMQKHLVCQFCDKVFAFKNYLSRHVSICHPTNDKPLKCCLCSFTTKTPAYIIGHTRRQHKEVEDPENAVQRALASLGDGEGNELSGSGMDIQEPI